MVPHLGSFSTSCVPVPIILMPLNSRKCCSIKRCISSSCWLKPDFSNSTIWQLLLNRSYATFFQSSWSSFAHTSSTTDASMTLDLGTDRAIGQVIIYNGRDCCQDRIVGCSVFVTPADHTQAPTFKSSQIASPLNILVFNGSDLICENRVTCTCLGFLIRCMILLQLT